MKKIDAILTFQAVFTWKYTVNVMHSNLSKIENSLLRAQVKLMWKTCMEYLPNDPLFSKLSYDMTWHKDIHNETTTVSFQTHGMANCPGVKSHIYSICNPYKCPY